MKALSLLVAVLVIAAERCDGQELVKEKAREVQLATNVSGDFSCVNRTRDMYFPDYTSGCRKFHLCTKAEAGEILNLSFMCPQGTAFDVKSADCQTAETVVCDGGDSAAVGALGPRATRKVNNQIGKHKFKVAAPNTSFKCGSKKLGRYYADLETNCTVFHLCTAGNYKTEVLDFQFMCVEGTTFDETEQQCTPSSTACGETKMATATSPPKAPMTSTPKTDDVTTTTAATTTSTSTSTTTTPPTPEEAFYDVNSFNVTDVEPEFYDYEAKEPPLPAEHIRERRSAIPVNIQGVVSLKRTRRAAAPSFNLDQLPQTSFTCVGKVPGGYYADVETGCQLYHVCSGGGGDGSGMQNFKFLCINGTVFSQQTRTCQAWYTVNCESTPQFVGLNDDLSQFVAEPAVDSIGDVALDQPIQQQQQQQQQATREQTPIRRPTTSRPTEQPRQVQSPIGSFSFGDNTHGDQGNRQIGQFLAQSSRGQSDFNSNQQTEQQNQQQQQRVEDAVPQFVVQQFQDISADQQVVDVVQSTSTAASTGTKRRGRKRGGRRRKQKAKTTTESVETQTEVAVPPPLQSQFEVDPTDHNSFSQHIQDTGFQSQSPQVSTLTTPQRTFAIQEQIPGLLEEIQVRGRFQQTEDDFMQDFLRDRQQNQQGQFVVNQQELFQSPRTVLQQEESIAVQQARPQINTFRQSPDSSQQPSDTTRQQSETFRQQADNSQLSDTFQQSTGRVRQPVNTFQQSTDSASQSADTFQQSSGRVRQPVNTFQQSTDSASQTADTFQQSSGRVRQPVNTFQQSTDSASQTADTFQQSSGSIQQQPDTSSASQSAGGHAVFDGFDSFIQSAIADEQEQRARLGPILERQRQEQIERQRQARLQEEREERERQEKRTRAKQNKRKRPKTTTTTSTEGPVPQFIAQFPTATQRPTLTSQQSLQVQAQLQHQIQEQLQQQQQQQMLQIQRQQQAQLPFFASFPPPARAPQAVTLIPQQQQQQQPAPFPFTTPFQQPLRPEGSQQPNLNQLFLQPQQFSNQPQQFSNQPQQFRSQPQRGASGPGPLSDFVFLVPAESEQLSRSVFHRGVSIDGERTSHILNFESPGSSGFELRRAKRANLFSQDTAPLDFLKLVNAATPDYPASPFSCRGKVVGGYYADEHTGCNMFHVCSIGRKKGLLYDFRFLCGNDTLFDQRSLTCNTFDKVACELSHKYFPRAPLPEESFDAPVPHAELFKVRIKRAVVGVDAIGPNDYPMTTFACTGRDPNKYYADPETNCELFHLCTEVSPGKGMADYRFLCKNGTVFDQRAQACDDQTDAYNCRDDPNHYGIGETFSRTHVLV